MHRVERVVDMEHHRGARTRRTEGDCNRRQARRSSRLSDRSTGPRAANRIVSLIRRLGEKAEDVRCGRLIPRSVLPVLPQQGTLSGSELPPPENEV